MKKVVTLVVSLMFIVSALMTGVMSRYTQTNELAQQTIGAREFQMDIDDSSYVTLNGIKLAPGDEVRRTVVVTNSGDVAMDVVLTTENSNLPAGMHYSLENNSFRLEKDGAQTATLVITWDYDDTRSDNYADFVNAEYTFQITAAATQVNEDKDF